MQLSISEYEKFLRQCIIEMPNKCITLDVNEFALKDIFLDLNEGENFISVDDSGEIFIAKRTMKGDMWQKISEHGSFKEASMQLHKENKIQ